MNKEKEIQDELDKYWGQLDRVEKMCDQNNRMLRWLIAEMIHTDKDVVDEMRLKAECNQPDITDILEGK